MLRDDNTGGQRPAPNVLGEPLEICSFKPMTGFYRDGCCNTGTADVGSHTVCVVVTVEFLEFSRARGNDLSTPMPEFGFPGLQAWRSLVFVCITVSGSIGGEQSAPRGVALHS